MSGTIRVNGNAVLVHGEVVSWELRNGTHVMHDDLIAHLNASGLDGSLVKELAPRNAFARACAELSEQRVIRKLSEDASEIRFQFTREAAEQDPSGVRLRYDFEAILTLDKVTGRVTCPTNGTLAGDATALVAHHSKVRNNPDIGRVIQRLFELNADLFPVRSQGGCYFVPARFGPFLERVEAFMGLIGGSLRRFPVPAGYAAGDRSVKESVEYGLGQIIGEYREAIEAFDEKTRDGTLTKMVERIQQTRFKAEAYAEFLADRKGEVESRIAELRAQLRLKVAQLGRGTAVPEPGVAAPVGAEGGVAVS